MGLFTRMETTARKIATSDKMNDAQKGEALSQMHNLMYLEGAMTALDETLPALSGKVADLVVEKLALLKVQSRYEIEIFDLMVNPVDIVCEQWQTEEDDSFARIKAMTPEDRKENIDQLNLAIRRRMDQVADINWELDGMAEATVPEG